MKHDNYLSLEERKMLGNIAIKAIVEAKPNATRIQCYRILHHAHFRVKNRKDRYFFKIKKGVGNEERTPTVFPNEHQHNPGELPIGVQGEPN
jgi:hypothetical protein